MAAEPILIVGGGPAGLVLAIELTRRDVPCRIIDHRSPDLPRDRAAFVKSRSLEIFAAYGFTEAFRQQGQAIDGFAFFSNGSEATSYRIDTIDSPFPWFLGIPESETEILLEEKLRQFGGVLERGLLFEDYEEETDGFTVRLKTAKGEEKRRVSWIVGADGLHSTVRDRAGIAFTGHDYASRWGVVDGRLANWPHAEDMVAVQFSPLIYAAPLGAGRRRIYFRADPGEDTSVAAVNRKLAGFGPGVELRDADTPQLFHAHCKIASAFRSGRVLLTGDAAHAISPTQAHGMNTGIQDSFNLGWKLALVAQGLAPDSLLDTYADERRAVADLVAQTGDEAEGLLARGDPEATAMIVEALSDTDQRAQMATDEAEVAYGYSRGPIVEDAGWPDAVPGAATLGCRVGDASDLVAGDRAGPTTLHDILSHGGHSLFVLIGEAGRNEVRDGLAQIRDAVARYGDRLKEYLVHTGEFAEPAEIPELLHDRAGSLHARLGCTGNGLALVRPDGHLGFRCAPISLGKLQRHLSKTFL